MDIAALMSFRQSITYSRACTVVSTVETIDDLEMIRYCDTVDGPLSIVVSDPTADFSAFTDIETITGLINCVVEHGATFI